METFVPSAATREYLRLKRAIHVSQRIITCLTLLLVVGEVSVWDKHAVNNLASNAISVVGYDIYRQLALIPAIQATENPDLRSRPLPGAHIGVPTEHADLYWLLATSLCDMILAETGGHVDLSSFWPMWLHTRTKDLRVLSANLRERFEPRKDQLSKQGTLTDKALKGPHFTRLKKIMKLLGLKDNPAEKLATAQGQLEVINKFRRAFENLQTLGLVDQGIEDLVPDLVPDITFANFFTIEETMPGYDIIVAGAAHRPGKILVGVRIRVNGSMPRSSVSVEYIYQDKLPSHPIFDQAVIPKPQAVVYVSPETSSCAIFSDGTSKVLYHNKIKQPEASEPGQPARQPVPDESGTNLGGSSTNPVVPTNNPVLSISPVVLSNPVAALQPHLVELLADLVLCGFKVEGLADDQLIGRAALVANTPDSTVKIAKTLHSLQKSFQQAFRWARGKHDDAVAAAISNPDIVITSTTTTTIFTGLVNYGLALMGLQVLLKMLQLQVWARLKYPDAGQLLGLITALSSSFWRATRDARPRLLALGKKQEHRDRAAAGDILAAAKREINKLIGSSFATKFFLPSSFLDYIQAALETRRNTAPVMVGAGKQMVAIRPFDTTSRHRSQAQEFSSIAREWNRLETEITSSGGLHHGVPDQAVGDPHHGGLHDGHGDPHLGAQGPGGQQDKPTVLRLIPEPRFGVKSKRNLEKLAGRATQVTQTRGRHVAGGSRVTHTVMAARTVLHAAPPATTCPVCRVGELVAVTPTAMVNLRARVFNFELSSSWTALDPALMSLDNARCTWSGCVLAMNPAPGGARGPDGPHKAVPGQHHGALGHGGQHHGELDHEGQHHGELDPAALNLLQPGDHGVDHRGLDVRGLGRGAGLGHPPHPWREDTCAPSRFNLSAVGDDRGGAFSSPIQGPAPGTLGAVVPAPSRPRFYLYPSAPAPPSPPPPSSSGRPVAPTPPAPSTPSLSASEALVVTATGDDGTLSKGRGSRGIRALPFTAAVIISILMKAFRSDSQGMSAAEFMKLKVYGAVLASRPRS